MTKDSPSDGGGSPAPLRPPQQTPHKAPCQHSAGSGANSSGCGPPPSPFHDDHRRELETLRAKLEEERLHSREARRCFAVEARELRQAAEQDRQLLADQLRSKWEQQRARELHQLREATARHREAEIRQLMRWKEAELREAQELLWQERDAAMRQARDLQRQLAKELVSHGGGGSRGEGGASGGGPNAESHTKLQEVLGKLRWEVDGDQAARIRHLKAELELERSLFLKYILEPFEGEPLPVGSPHRFSQASSPQHLGRARPHSWQSRTAASTPDVTSVFRSRSLVNNPSRGESPCSHPLLEEGSPSDSSCQERSQKKALGKELDVEKESKQEASVDSPPKGRVGTWGAAGECAQEAQPQQGWLSGNRYNQLVKQNTDLLKALRELEQRCTRLREENTLLRRSSFPDRVKWLKRKAAELAVIAQRLDESSKKFQELRLLKLCENLRREVEEKQKRCDEIELKLNTMLSENARLSEENSQLQKENKQEEKIENENADLKVKLIQATDERNSAVQLAEGLEAKIENLEQVIKDMKQTAERQQRSKSEHEKTLLELQKKEEEIQRLQQAQREIKRHYEEEVQLLDAEVNELENHYHSQIEHFDLLSQELERLQIQKSGILGSELSQATCSSTGTSCPEKWEQETYHDLHCSDSTNDEDRASVASVDLIKSPLKLLVFLARDSYDPFDGPNKTPEAELPLTAGEYVYVCGDMDEDGFYEGELMDGRRGMVPSNMVEEVAGNDLISFIPSEPSDISYNSFHETSFPCQCASSDRRSSSPDEEDVCVSLLSKTPEGTVRDTQAAVPYPQNLTLLKQSAKSIVIGWDLPQVPESWGEVLSYNIYVNAELRQNVKEGSEMRTVIENLDLKLQTYRISVQSVTDKGHSDEMQCTFLVGNTSHIAPTLPNLRNITATSAEITWLPSNSNYTHAVYLNEKEYGVTKAGVHWYTFQNLRPNTQYSVKVVPLVPNEVLVYPQRGLEQGSTEVTFTTPSAGPTDAPLDVQVHAGSFADILVINWLPVTIHASGTSNGVQVTGYAIYVSGQKVSEIMSPTAGSVSLEVSQLKMLQGPQTVSVRTVSPFGESGDSEIQSVMTPKEYS
uniref:RIMS-binding protein 3A-like n=1 Tax=Euleptes europaea TaxID=460621 RepID=UPI0025405DD4|nr:RIMS-binding protein 3A-like [Euleptes europaea]